jgi:galactoside O-acetyltransferase
MENSFLSETELLAAGFASFGKEVYISRYSRIYGKSNLHLGDHVRIDDFTVIYVGQQSFVGSYVHIAPHVVISSPLSLNIGGNSTISSRCAIYGQTDDYSGEFLTNPTVPSDLRKVDCSEINIGAHVIIGSGSTIFPGCDIAEGTAVGAMTLVNCNTEPWSLYVGIPAKRIKARSRRGLEKLT